MGMLIYGCKEKLDIPNYTIILSSLLHNIYIYNTKLPLQSGFFVCVGDVV